MISHDNYVIITYTTATSRRFVSIRYVGRLLIVFLVADRVRVYERYRLSCKTDVRIADDVFWISNATDRPAAVDF